MKKKISVFTLLLSLMLAFVVPVQVKANDDAKYTDVEDFMHSLGYATFESSEGCVYAIYINGDYLYVHEYYLAPEGYYDFLAIGNCVYYVSSFQTGSTKGYRYYSPSKATELNDFNFNKSTSNQTSSNTELYKQDLWYYEQEDDYYMSYHLTYDQLVYSDLDVYKESLSESDSIPKYDNIVFHSSKRVDYTFPLWCADAGLNCQASSNESSSVIPYSFNSYCHIVRKSSSGKWLLTTIGNSVLHENIDDYRFYVGENGNLHVASIYGGDDVNGYKLNVRQYEYDTDGWKLRTYETFDTRDYSGVVDLGAGSGFDDSRLLAYTSESIYDHNGSVPLYEKSTEYFDVTNTPDTPDTPVSPTSTPSNPSGGSGAEGGGTGGGTRPESPDIGGDVEPGGGLDFIISLFTKIWTDICSVNLSVDGYSINLQQIVIYGALVSIVGGFIMHFIFGRR